MRSRILIFLILLGALVAFPAVARPNDPSYPKQWGMFTIGAEDAWDKATGKSVIVAIVDTGIDLEHPDLKDQIVQGVDLLENDEPDDENGHGSHVAGIAAAVTNNGVGVVGVAPKARLMPVRILDEVGTNLNPTNPTKLFANVAAGVKWAADHGAQVINMSFGNAGGGGPGSAIASAIQYAWSKGAICVVAAGNDSGESSGYVNENAVIVAATTRSDARADFSNIVDKAKWGISAPGSEIYSTLCCTLDLMDGNPDGYGTLDGTSMAAPHVSGAAAVLRSMGLSPQQTVDRLLATAADLGPKGRDSTYGAGRLDLAAAVGAGQAGTSSGGTPGGASSGGTGASGGPRAQGQASQSTGSGTGTKPPGSSLGGYKDPERKTAAAGEHKNPLSVKTLINIGAAVVLLGAGIAWYLWHRRRAIAEE